MTQCERILNYLERGHSVTPLQSWRELGVYRLSARIHDLRNAGHDILSETVTVTNAYGESCKVSRYYLGTKQPELAL